MQAIVLAAGFGSRLRGLGLSKPLVEVAGQPLLRHILTRLHAAGLERAVIVTGHLAGDVEAAVDAWRLPLTATFVRTDPAQPNGVSASATQAHVNGRSLLVMSDHLVDADIYRAMAALAPAKGELVLAVDRRLGNPLVDEDDVTRVRTVGDRIIGIGKGLADYDAYDTGVFSIDAAFLATLASLPSPGLSDGVAALARLGRARAFDIGDRNWIDIDDVRMHRLAEAWLASAEAQQ